MRNFPNRLKVHVISGLSLVVLAIITTVSFYYGQHQWVLYRKAEDLYAKHEYRKAIYYYHKAIKEKIDLWYVGDHLSKSCASINACSLSLEIYEQLIKDNPDNIYILMASATFYINLHRFDKAIILYKRALSLKPRNHKILHDLAQSYQWNEQYLLAIKTYKKLLNLMKKPSLLVLLEIGDCYILDEQYFKALKYYQKVLEKTPNSFAVRKKIALAYSWTGQENKGVKILEELYEKRPENFYLGLDIAKIYMQDRLYEKADKLLKDLHKQAPDNYDIIYQMSVLEITLGHMMEARKIWEEAIKVSHNGEDLRLFYAEAMQKWGDDYQAERIYKKYLKKNSHNLNVYCEYIFLLMNTDRFFEAQSLISKLLAENRTSTKLYEQMAMINFEKGDYFLALYWIKKVLSEDSVNSQARLLKARCFIKMKNFEKVEEEIKQMPQSFLLKEEGFLEIGKLYLEMGQIDKAKKYFLRAVELERDDVLLSFYVQFLVEQKEELITEYAQKDLTSLELQKLADIISSYNFLEKATVLYQKSLEKDPKNFNAKLGLAVNLSEMKEYDASLKHLFALLEDFPNDNKLILFVARNYRLKKEYDIASKFYQHLHTLNPKDYLIVQEEAQMAYSEKKPNKAWQIYKKQLYPSVDTFLVEKLGKLGLLEKIKPYQDINVQNSSTYQFYSKVYEKWQQGKYFLNKEDDKKMHIALLKLNSLYNQQRLLHLESEAKWLIWQYKFREAEEILEKILKDYPMNIDSLFDYSQVQCLFGKKDKSIKAIEKILDIQPFHNIAKRAYIISKIRQNPFIEMSYYHWDEEGRGELNRIRTNRYDLLLGFPFYGRHKLIFKGQYWHEKPTFSGGQSSWAKGYTIEADILLSEYMKTEAGFQQKIYDKNIYPTANSGFFDFWLTMDNIELGCGYKKKNYLENYFALLQKTQYDMAWVALKARIKRRLEINCIGRWRALNDNNSMQYHDIHIYYDVLTLPTQLRGFVAVEIRDTRHKDILVNNSAGNLINIIYPYWAPKKYIAARGGIEWFQDLSSLYLCSAQKHYYIIKILAGNDSEKDALIRAEGEWHIEFFDHWLFGVKLMIHRALQWEANEATIELRYQF